MAAAGARPPVGQEQAARAAEAWRFFRDVLGSPRYIAAPMVGQSELPYRLLLRRSGCDLCYTPMLHADEFAGSGQEEMVRQGFETCAEDRPLVAQFCAKTPEDFLEAALMVQDRCDAVDLNLGCPQWKALKGGWGGALMDDENWHLVYSIVRKAAASELRVPVFCKMRVFADDRKTVRFAQMLQDAGCSLLTVHGRQRDRELHHAPARWSAIRAVREALSIPVVANGGVSSRASAERCLERTGCAGVMVATALLADPELLLPGPGGPAEEKDGGEPGDAEESEASAPSAGSTRCTQGDEQWAPALRRAEAQCLRYLALCEEHPPWSVRAPRDHLRAILAAPCRSSPAGVGALDALDAVGASAASSPPARAAEERAAHWRGLCREFRDALRALCARLESLGDGARAAGGAAAAAPAAAAAQGAAGQRAALAAPAASALARRTPVSSRYAESKQRQAAAIRSCLASASATAKPQRRRA